MSWTNSVHKVGRALESHRKVVPRTPAVALALAIAIGLGSSLSPAPVGAATEWHDTVGAQSQHEGIQALAFLPNEFWIDVGDSITWKFDAEEPHTVTLGTTTGNPFATPKECNGVPTSADQCTWNGSSIVNSALQEKGATFKVTFTTTGDYQYICLLHPSTMTGTAHVRALGTPYPHDQHFYDRQGKEQEHRLIEMGKQILHQERDATDKHGNQVIVGNVEPIVTTGGGVQSVFTPRFVRSEMTVHVGETVTWTAPDSLTPHTVTFGDEEAAENNPNPVNLTGPGEKTTLSTPYPKLMEGPTVSSGFLGDSNPAWHGSTFQVTFTAPGTYRYYCALHDDLGMVGTIKVVGH